MTSRQRLEAINSILDDYDAYEADAVAGGIIEAHTKREMAYATMLMSIYSISHKAGSCDACRDPESV